MVKTHAKRVLKIIRILKKTYEKHISKGLVDLRGDEEETKEEPKEYSSQPEMKSEKTETDWQKTEPQDKKEESTNSLFDGLTIHLG